ncbi:hypothetical protein CPSG_02821 [Coccidioides posadasii str. Silveira]|uniref:Uncharacterized protein n=1 Tax=Coccidioides posadasii (strain RMSCC 757 / Silveira) TaxID=443226 RepID=E9CYF1_COCPS|nr:hypothetical protein CPSG_02821 [Coccidioides posadasii str. Silveira]
MVWSLSSCPIDQPMTKMPRWKSAHACESCVRIGDGDSDVTAHRKVPCQPCGNRSRTPFFTRHPHSGAFQASIISGYNPSGLSFVNHMMKLVKARWPPLCPPPDFACRSMELMETKRLARATPNSPNCNRISVGMMLHTNPASNA